MADPRGGWAAPAATDQRARASMGQQVLDMRSNEEDRVFEMRLCFDLKREERKREGRGRRRPAGQPMAGPTAAHQVGVAAKVSRPGWGESILFAE